MIGRYRVLLSPLLVPALVFVSTCSAMVAGGTLLGAYSPSGIVAISRDNSSGAGFVAVCSGDFDLRINRELHQKGNVGG